MSPPQPVPFREYGCIVGVNRDPTVRCVLCCRVRGREMCYSSTLPSAEHTCRGVQTTGIASLSHRSPETGTLPGAQTHSLQFTPVTVHVADTVSFLHASGPHQSMFPHTCLRSTLPSGNWKRNRTCSPRARRTTRAATVAINDTHRFMMGRPPHHKISEPINVAICHVRSV